MKTLKAVLLATGLLFTASAAAAQAPDGKALYEKSCKMCHGVDGTPPAAMLKMMPTLPSLDSSYMASRSEDSVVAVLKNGTVKMKSYTGKLSPEEMAAVAKYVREMALKAKGTQ